MNLAPIDLINGLLSIIFVAISIIVGLKILLKYFKFKQRNLLLVGLTWIGLVSIWYASSISILLILTTGSGISAETYMFLGNGLLPITSFIWIIAFTDLLFKKKQKEILILFGVYNAVFETLFLYFLFTNPSFLGVVTGPVDANYGLFMTTYHFSLLIMIFITGTLFARESIRAENKEVKMKGKFLIIAFYSLIVEAVLEIFSNYSLIILVLARLILIVSSFTFYCGFTLPNLIKKIVLKIE